MSLLVVGSIALDDLKMPDGKKHKDVLGGSCTYFSVAASHTVPVRVVGVVGGDFPYQHLDFLRRHRVDTEGLLIEPEGKTFRWAGTYAKNMDDRTTDDLQFGVFGGFDARLPEKYKDSTHVFLACIMPALQLKVLKQMRRKPVAVCDTIQFYIETDRKNLMKVFKAADGVIVNDSEAKLLFGDDNAVRCAQAFLKSGSRFAVVKKGAHGAILATKDGVFPVPAYPLAKVVDPTGAGDCFAGGFMAWLDKKQKADTKTLRQAMVHGTAVASFACEGVGVTRLAKLTKAELAARAKQFTQLLRIP